MKKYSLKRRVLFLMAGFCVGVLLIGIVNAAAAFKGRSQMQKMYELFAIYNDYDDAIEELKETTVDYFIHGKKRKYRKLFENIFIKCKAKSHIKFFYTIHRTAKQFYDGNCRHTNRNGNRTLSHNQQRKSQHGI